MHDGINVIGRLTANHWGTALDDPPEVERLLAHLIGLTGYATCELGQGRVQQIAVTGPHRLFNSGALRRLLGHIPKTESNPMTPADRYLMTTVKSAFAARLVRLEYALPADAIQVCADRMVVHIGTLPFGDRFVLLTETYRALANDDLPNLYLCQGASLVSGALLAGFEHPSQLDEARAQAAILRRTLTDYGYRIDVLSSAGSHAWWGQYLQYSNTVIRTLRSLLSRIDGITFKRAAGDPRAFVVDLGVAQSVPALRSLFSADGAAIGQLPEEWDVKDASLIQFLQRTAHHYCLVDQGVVIISPRKLDHLMALVRLRGAPYSARTLQRVLQELLAHIWEHVRPPTAPQVHNVRTLLNPMWFVGVPLGEVTVAAVTAAEESLRLWLPDMAPELRWTVLETSGQPAGATGE